MRPILANSCAAAATAAEASYRLPILPRDTWRTSRVIALDPAAAEVVRRVAAQPWASATFYTIGGTSGAGTTGAGATGAGATGAGAIGDDAIGAGATGAGAVGDDAVGDDATGAGAVGDDAVGDDATGAGAIGFLCTLDGTPCGLAEVLPGADLAVLVATSDSGAAMAAA